MMYPNLLWLFNMSEYPSIVGVLGLRRSLIVGSSSYVLFVASNIYYQVWLVYVSSALLGFGAAFLWTAQGAFVARCSRDEDRRSQQMPGAHLGDFNGAFFGIFQANQFLGNLLVALMFQYDVNAITIFMVATVLCGIGSASLVLLDTPREDLMINAQSRGISQFVAQVTDVRLILLIPLMLLSGALQSFVVGDFAALARSNSIRFFLMATYGFFNAGSSIWLGKLSDRIGRIPVIAFGQLSHLILSVVIWSKPDFATYASLAPIALSFGMIDAAYNTVSHSIIGALFTDVEAAFSCFPLFQSAMTAFAFFIRHSTDYGQRVSIGLFLVILSSVSISHLHLNVQNLERTPNANWARVDTE